MQQVVMVVVVAEARRKQQLRSDSTRLRRRTLIASLKESKRASKQGSMQASMVWAGESEWVGVVLVVKGIGQGCLIGQGLDGDATSHGHVVVKVWA